MDGMPDRLRSTLSNPVAWPSRVMLLLAVVALVFVAVFPLWTLSFESNQYPDPLRLSIHATHLQGQKSDMRDDLREVNSLNHYIGMRELQGNDFPEFVWLPLASAALALVLLRAALLADRRALIDAVLVYVGFAIGSGWAFYHRMYEYGHNLAFDAPIKVAPFTPPLFGRVKVANFWVESYPGGASVAFVAAGIFLAVAVAAAYWHSRPSSAVQTREAVA